MGEVAGYTPGIGGSEEGVGEEVGITDDPGCIDDDSDERMDKIVSVVMGSTTVSDEVGSTIASDDDNDDVSENVDNSYELELSVN